MAVLTVSDSRSLENDSAGDLMVAALTDAGHSVAVRHLLRDETAEVRDWLLEQRGRVDVDVILINGGTGISPRDRTYEAVTGALDREIPGFGELFRWLSHQEVGAAAMASRAVAGVMGDKIVFCTPGSPAAVRLAMEKLILPEAAHLVGEVRKTS